MNSRGHKKILIVDDTAANLVALRMALRGMHVEIIEASSGNQALSILLREQIDLILMDVRMPGMDGYETARCLADLEEYKDIQVVFVTGDVQALDREHEFSHAPHIFKPIIKEEIQQTINKILAERHKEIYGA